jgi:hypothetical protein
MFGDKITQSVAEAVKQILATEKLHPNQQKLDVHEPEKDKLTRKDFEMLRSNKKPKNEAFNPLKHIVNPSPAVKTAAKDVKRGSYADRAALMKAGGVKDDRGPRGVTKEEVEQIDELSTKTLAKAAGAASDPDSDYSYGKSHDPQKFADHAKKTKDAKSAAAVQGAADAKGHYPRDNRTQGYDKLANRTPARVTAAGKANKQDVNKLKGNIKRNEEVEEAVESPFTSYKKPREIESRGGSGIKQGTRYGGGKQKDVPTQDEAPKTKKPKGMMNFKEMFGE